MASPSVPDTYLLPTSVSYQRIIRPIIQDLPSLILSPAAVPATQPPKADFTLGDLDCPCLTGHPDIRY